MIAMVVELLPETMYVGTLGPAVVVYIGIGSAKKTSGGVFNPALGLM
jgi:hypothetical protein